MDDHIRKLNIRIRNKETELNELFTKIQKLEEEITSQNINLQKAGNSRDVINGRPYISWCICWKNCSIMQTLM